MELEIYQDQNGNEPFLDWLSSKKDKSTAARIRSRLRRIEELAIWVIFGQLEMEFMNFEYSLDLGTEFTSEE